MERNLTLAIAEFADLMPNGAVLTWTEGTCQELRPDAQTPGDTCGAAGALGVRITGLPHGREVQTRRLCPEHGGACAALAEAGRDWMLLAPASVGGPFEVHEAGAMQIDSRGTVATVRNLALFEKVQPARVRVGLDPATHAELVRTIGERAAMHAGWRGRSRSLLPTDAEATIAWLRSVLGPDATIRQDPETPKAPPADDGRQWQAFIGTGSRERTVGGRTDRWTALNNALGAARVECDRQREVIYAARGLAFETCGTPAWGLPLPSKLDILLREVRPGGEEVAVPFCAACGTAESWSEQYGECGQCGAR